MRFACAFGVKYDTAIANAARAVGEDKNATRLERQQATAMISLSFYHVGSPHLWLLKRC